MAKLRDGAKDLGLTTSWGYAFVKPGTSLETTADVVFLDVGGCLSFGVIDQHSDQTLGDSTGQLIERYPEHVYQHLLGEWLRRRDDGQDLKGRVWRPRIATHIEPDFDAAVSALLVQHLIEDGELPPWAPGLIAYAAQVDQGRYQMALGDGLPGEDVVRAELAPVHHAFLALQNLRGDKSRSPAERDTARLLRGMDLIRAEIDSVVKASGGRAWSLNAASFWPDQSAATGRAAATAAKGVGGWRADARFGDLAEMLDGDWERHLSDWAKAERTDVLVPERATGEPITVRGVILYEPPSAVLHKYWCRGRQHPFTLTPAHPDYRGGKRDDVNGKVRYSVVITSVDSEWADDKGRKLALYGLGARLEQRECSVRAADGGDTRVRKPRWPDVTNDDPWYDGRAHGYGIVDAPRSSTQLTLEAIIEVATKERYWEIPAAGISVVVLRRINDQDGAKGNTVTQPKDTTTPMKHWFNASSESQNSSALPDCLRDAFEGGAVVRTFPSKTAGPMVIYRLTATKTATLQTMQRALDELRQDAGRSEHGPPIVLMQHALPATTRNLPMLEEKIVGSVLSPLGAGRSDALLLGDHGAVVRLEGPNDDGSRLTSLVEAFTYLYFLRETLSLYSERIVNALGAIHGEPIESAIHGEEPEAASTVQSDFLHFQARFYQLEVSHHHETQAVYSEMRKRLEIQPYYAEVLQELERLADYEAQKTQERARNAEELMNFMLVAVSATGIVQTITSLISLNLTGEVRGIHWPPTNFSEALLIVIVPALLFVLVLAILRIWLTRSRSQG